MTFGFFSMSFVGLTHADTADDEDEGDRDEDSEGESGGEESHR